MPYVLISMSTPLIFSYYLNGLLEYLKNSNNKGIQIKYWNGETMELLALIALLFCLPTIPFSWQIPPQTFQKCLDDFDQYCKQYKLKSKCRATDKILGQLVFTASFLQQLVFSLKTICQLFLFTIWSKRTYISGSD